MLCVRQEIVLMSKKVIYSALVGNYDEIRQPVVVSEEFDYILFSNDIAEERIGVWQVRPINYTNSIQTKIARYVKTHPEELLPEYDYSVWMDSNIIIKAAEVYAIINEFIDKGTLVASIAHQHRHCIYEELATVLEYNLEIEEVIDRWNTLLNNENYPENNGLFETNVLFRAHKNKQVEEVDKLWWWCVDTYSRRDQLSFNYVLWKFNVPAVYLLGEGIDTYISPFFERVKHRHTPNRNLTNEVEFQKVLTYSRRALRIKMDYVRQGTNGTDFIRSALEQFYLLLIPKAIRWNDSAFIQEANDYFKSLNMDIGEYQYTVQELDSIKTSYAQIQKSHAYRIGKKIVSPFAWMKNWIKACKK